MALEDLVGSNKFIDDLDSANPVGSTDYVASLDDHIRGIKTVLRNCFINVTGAVTATFTEMNYLVGVTSLIQGQLDAKASLTSPTISGPTFTGDAAVPNITGGTIVKGTMTFNDGVALEFGTLGVDSDISSDGSNTIWDLKAASDLYISGDGTTRFLFDGSSGDFHADGDVYAASTSVGSDPRLKHDIRTIQNALAKVNALNGVTFRWNKDDSEDAGLISTDVEDVLPEAVKYGKLLGEVPDIQTVNYNAVVGLLVEAVRELTEKVRILEEK